MEKFADLYTDYLVSASSYTTATGMASLLSIKHDKITQQLASAATTVNIFGNMLSLTSKK